MNALKIFCAILFCAAAQSTLIAQGTFIYDQQSAVVEDYPNDGGILPSMEVDQSFTPNLNSVGFVSFEFQSFLPQSHGGSIAVYLMQDSISGPILATSDSVMLPSSYSAIATFLFSSPVNVTPGNTYYFEPVMLSGDSIYAVGGGTQYNYNGGSAFFNGAQDPNFDLWFREGIMAVPEPSTCSLAACATVLIFIAQCRRRGLSLNGI